MPRQSTIRTLLALAIIGALTTWAACAGDAGPDGGTVPVATITIAPARDTIAPGGGVQLFATLKDASGNSLTGRTVTWSSSSAAVAEVSAEGLVSGVIEGSVTITAAVEGKQGTATVVVRIPVATVEVTPAADTIIPNGTVQLTATSRDAAGHLLAGRNVIWTSSFQGTATVTTSGLVHGIADGTVTITANAEGMDGVATVVVVAPGSIEVTPASPSLSAGRTLQLTATLKDAEGNILPGGIFEWSTSDSAVASVSGNGLVRAVSLGSATIAAAFNGLSGATVVTIVPEAIPSFTSVFARMLSTCGTSPAGAAYCWGAGFSNTLGNGTAPQTSPPVLVSGGLTFESVTTSSTHSCSVTTTGAGYCWGGGDLGFIGDGTNDPRLTPVPVVGGLAFSFIGVGQQQSCGLTTAGAVYCWGSGSGGNLGNGGSAGSLTPVPVSGGHSFTALAVGFRHACGLVGDGSAWCWGDNHDGEIGDGTTTNALVPTLVSGGLVFSSLSAGTSSTCGIIAGGAGYCWGVNGSGQVGDGTTTSRPVPAAVGGGLAFAELSPGDQLTCGLTTSGSAYCWGGNGRGGLGDGTNNPSLVPVAVSGGLTFESISVGYQFACGITTGHVGYCWGRNDYDQLGDGTTSDSKVPVKVIGQP